MPELACEACNATWTAGIDGILQSDYWSATTHFAAIYATDVFFLFEEMKMAVPGLSCQALLRMLDQQTVRFGRMSIKVSILFMSQCLNGYQNISLLMCTTILRIQDITICPFAVFQSEEQAIFDGVFIAKDEDVTRFVNLNTKHNQTCNVADYNQLSINSFSINENSGR